MAHDPCSNEIEDRAKTGAPGLDEVLCGGLIPRQLYLLEGEPGTGKTTLAMQFLLEGLRAGEKVLYVTLSETEAELRGVAGSHGWSFEGIETLELVPTEQDLASESQLTMFQPSEVELSDVTKSIIAAVDRLDPRRIVLDSVTELRLLAQSQLRFRRQVLALKQLFSARGCTVLLLDDLLGSDLHLKSVAHAIIVLEQLAPEYGRERRRLRVVKFRGSSFRGGYHDFSIRTGGIAVFPRMVAAELEAGFEPGRTPSGVAALDALLGGGLERGTSTLLIGAAGTGKSTIAAQYAAAAAKRGDHAVIFAFDENLIILRARMAALGLAFRDGDGPGAVQLQQIDPAQVSPGEFAQLVRRCVERDGARVVVLDSLNGYVNAMPEERSLIVQLYELLRYLGQCGVTTLLVVAQHGLIGPMPQAQIDTSYLADTVVLLRFFEAQGHVKKAISVVKKRGGRHEATIRELVMDERGIHLSAPLEQFQGVLTGMPLLARATARAEDRERHS